MIDESRLVACFYFVIDQTCSVVVVLREAILQDFAGSSTIKSICKKTSGDGETCLDDSTDLKVSFVQESLKDRNGTVVQSVMYEVRDHVSFVMQKVIDCGDVVDDGRICDVVCREVGFEVGTGDTAVDDHGRGLHKNEKNEFFVRGEVIHGAEAAVAVEVIVAWRNRMWKR